MNTELVRLRDRAALEDLISRYALSVDARDITAIVECFTEDARVEFNGGAAVVRGRDDLARFFADTFESPMLGAAGVSSHLMTDGLVSLSGDTAHVETQAIACHANDERDSVIMRGLRYADDCERRDGEWLIGRRIHRATWEAHAPGGPFRSVAQPAGEGAGTET